MTTSSLAGVSGEHVGRRVEDDRGVVDGGGRLAEADRDEPDLAGVVGDVAGGEDARQVGPYRGVDDHVALLRLQAPLLDRAEVGDEPERGDERLRLPDLRLLAVDADGDLLEV